MIAFSIMMWFCSAIVIILSISLLKGNYSSMHGSVFDRTEDKEGYAKAVGKPVLLVGIGIGITGVSAIVIQGSYSIIISLIFMVLVILIAGLWFVKIQKRWGVRDENTKEVYMVSRRK